jgi:rod shape-determining protein MreC
MGRQEFKRDRWRAPVEFRMHRTGLIGFGILAVVLMLLNRADSTYVEKGRAALADISSGLMGGFSATGEWASRAVASVTNLATLYDQNAALRVENDELLAWRAKALELERRVHQFESMLNIAYTPITDVTAASVIADSSGPFSRALIVNVGASQGVKEGDAALDRFGLAGRVIATGYGSSRVLLLSDPASRVPVLIEQAGVEGIVSGDVTGLPRLEFVPGRVPLRGGETVLTSGAGGLFPPGLPVGTIAMDEDGSARVRLFADFARLEVVAIKRFEIHNDVPEPGELMSRGPRDPDAPENAELRPRGLPGAPAAPAVQ